MNNLFRELGVRKRTLYHTEFLGDALAIEEADLVLFVSVHPPLCSGITIIIMGPQILPLKALILEKKVIFYLAGLLPSAI